MVKHSGFIFQTVEQRFLFLDHTGHYCLIDYQDGATLFPHGNPRKLPDGKWNLVVDFFKEMLGETAPFRVQDFMVAVPAYSISEIRIGGYET